MADQPYTDEAHRPLSDEAIEQARRANARYESHCNGEDDSDEARRQPMYWPETRWLATLDERTRERDEARSGLDRAAHALNLRTDATAGEVAQWVEEQARLLRLSAEEDHSEAISLREELDAVARALGVSSDLDGAEKTRRCVAAVASLRERLSVVERERDAEAHAASNHAECAERMLASACDLRDALDSVAGALGVDTSTDAETEARACVAAVVALREEVDRLRSAVGGEQESAEQQRERAYAAERRAEEAERRLRDAEGALLSTAKTIVGVADERLCWCGDCDDEHDEPTCAAARSVATDIRRALDAIDDAALPSHEQTPAPSGEHEVERLRARVRELEGRLEGVSAVMRAEDRLIENVKAKLLDDGAAWFERSARVMKGTLRPCCIEQMQDNAKVWRALAETHRERAAIAIEAAALPSQEQPDAPPTSTPEAPSTPEGEPDCDAALMSMLLGPSMCILPGGHDGPHQNMDGAEWGDEGEPAPTSTPEAPRPECDECGGGGWLDDETECGECPGGDGAAPSTPEGEPADDDADPSRWQPGDVVARGDGREERTLLSRYCAGWRVETHPPGQGPMHIRDDHLRREGWHRIRRAEEGSR